jgi:hypothetical protein
MLLRAPPGILASDLTAGELEEFLELAIDIVVPG